MEMKQIIKELETKLEENKSQVEDWEAKINFWTEAVKTAEKELAIAKDNIASLEMMIEAAKEGHFGLISRKVSEKKTAMVINKEIEPETEKVAEEDDSEKEKEHPDNRHKNACVLKLNRYANVEDRWRTQKQAAKALNWDQSSVCKFMKLNTETQINKKGFALVWEY